MSHVDDGKLHTYLDGECSERERQQIEEHLSACMVCRERLVEAKTSSQRASNILAELETGPVHAPSWHEIEQRAAARKEATPQRVWLRPGLAWAAVIALAFGVGWISNSYWSRIPDQLGGATLRGEAPATDVAQDDSRQLEQEVKAAEGDAPSEGLGEPEIAAPPSEPVLAGGDGPQEQETPDAHRGDRLVAAPPGDQATRPPGEALQLEAERRVAKLEEGAAETGQRARGVPRDADDMPLQPAAFRAAAEADALAPDRFVDLRPDEAAVWIDAELRTIPDLRLERVEVGPGSAVAGGLAGLPAVKLTYSDAAGHEIIFIQQRLTGIDLASDDSEPTLIVEPTGLRTYRWHDDRGYRLLLIGEIGSDSLRALAARVR